MCGQLEKGKFKGIVTTCTEHRNVDRLSRENVMGIFDFNRKNQEKIKTFSVPIDFILYCMRPKMNKVVQWNKYFITFSFSVHHK